VHVNRGLLGWGVFFIIVGVVPLAVESGVLNESLVLRAWELWPLILIGIGLGLMLQRTKAAVVGNLVVAVTAGLMLGGVLSAGINGLDGFGGFSACNVGDGGVTPFAEQRASFEGDASYGVNLDCGNVSIGTAPGNDWTLTGSSADGRPPELTVRANGLDVRTQERENGNISIGTNAGVEWAMTLPQGPRSRLDLQVNAGSASADLDGLSLSRLDAQVNAGSATLDLSSAVAIDRMTASVNAGSLSVSFPAVDVTADLSANAGSLEICVPDGVDLRIRLEDNTLGSNNFADEGLVERNGTWVTPDVGTGSAMIALTTSANLGSIDLNPEDGCAD
jgi:hypothetical protein